MEALGYLSKRRAFELTYGRARKATDGSLIECSSKGNWEYPRCVRDGIEAVDVWRRGWGKELLDPSCRDRGPDLVKQALLTYRPVFYMQITAVMRLSVPYSLPLHRR